MLFNSLEYFLLLLVSVLAYWTLPKLRYRKILLLLASLVFYASWSVPFIGLLIFSMGISWFLVIQHHATGRPWPILAAIVINLGVLCYFKYANFFLDNIEIAFESLGASTTLPNYHILLPLGISFYTFQIMGYVIDVYRRQILPEKNLFSFALFIMFFPQLVAGPICRAKELLPQLKKKMIFDIDAITGGILILSIGLFLKVTFADGLAPYIDEVFADPGRADGTRAFWATLGYGVQILCDFWGYSTMAVGSAMLFGYRIPINFNLPYFSLSIRDFWRRWHITLSSWLKDYLYIPLGGSRNGKLLTKRNLLLTMLLGGLWHGAAWTFVLWGLIHGVALITERVLGDLFSGSSKGKNEAASLLHLCLNFLKWLKTMIIVFTAWIFFRAADVDDALMIIRLILTDLPLMLVLDGFEKGFFILFFGFVICHWFLHLAIASVYSGKRGFLLSRLGISAVLLTSSIIFSAEETKKFIYFEF